MTSYFRKKKHQGLFKNYYFTTRKFEILPTSSLVYNLLKYELYIYIYITIYNYIYITIYIYKTIHIYIHIYKTLQAAHLLLLSGIVARRCLADIDFIFDFTHTRPDIIAIMQITVRTALRLLLNTCSSATLRSPFFHRSSASASSSSSSSSSSS